MLLSCSSWYNEKEKSHPKSPCPYGPQAESLAEERTWKMNTQKAIDFIKSNARPIELAEFACHFENGSKQAALAMPWSRTTGIPIPPPLPPMPPLATYFRPAPWVRLKRWLPAQRATYSAAIPLTRKGSSGFPPLIATRTTPMLFGGKKGKMMCPAGTLLFP